MEAYYKNIGLADIEIYYLAKEMGLKQIVGLDIDYDSLNKEVKNEAHQACYDFFNANNILDMDFSGNTVVDAAYAEIISAFENPDYCCVLYHCDKKNGERACRKLYKNGNVWTALDYFDDEKSAVFVFPDIEKANEFMFEPIGIQPANGACPPKDETVYRIADYASFDEKAEQTVAVTEYIQKDGKHIAQQYLYVQQDGFWYSVQSTDETFMRVPVESAVALNESEGK